MRGLLVVHRLTKATSKIAVLSERAVPVDEHIVWSVVSIATKL